MPFAAGLRDSLLVREDEATHELANGDGLERVLTKHLLAVEGMADDPILTSILLLDGTTLRHAAAPNLPAAYCEAIDGASIGPAVGSCGTAAYWGRPVYVTDIASDPLWADYRDHALGHGLRACWSTPIRDGEEAVIGTFAIYRRNVGGPSAEEIDAIGVITQHVAQAILRARDPDERVPTPKRHKPDLKLVTNERSLHPFDPIFSLRNGKVLVSWSDSERTLDLGPEGEVAKVMRRFLDGLCD
jgi:hypothetical protein